MLNVCDDEISIAITVHWIECNYFILCLPVVSACEVTWVLVSSAGTIKEIIWSVYLKIY